MKKNIMPWGPISQTLQLRIGLSYIRFNWFSQHACDLFRCLGKSTDGADWFWTGSLRILPRKTFKYKRNWGAAGTVSGSSCLGFKNLGVTTLRNMKTLDWKYQNWRTNHHPTCPPLDIKAFASSEKMKGCEEKLTYDGGWNQCACIKRLP